MKKVDVLLNEGKLVGLETKQRIKKLGYKEISLLSQVYQYKLWLLNDLITPKAYQICIKAVERIYKE